MKGILNLLKRLIWNGLIIKIGGEGKTPLAAYFTKIVRDKLPAKPVSTKKRACRNLYSVSRDL